MALWKVAANRMRSLRSNIDAGFACRFHFGYTEMRRKGKWSGNAEKGKIVRKIRRRINGIRGVGVGIRLVDRCRSSPRRLCPLDTLRLPAFGFLLCACRPYPWGCAKNDFFGMPARVGNLGVCGGFAVSGEYLGRCDSGICSCTLHGCLPNCRAVGVFRQALATENDISAAVARLLALCDGGSHRRYCPAALFSPSNNRQRRGDGAYRPFPACFPKGVCRSGGFAGR